MLNEYLEFDATVNYQEGAIVLINGIAHTLFRNIYLNNELIWTPVDVVPIGYILLDEEKDVS